MAFRASNVIPATQYDVAKRIAVQVRRLAESRSTTFASGATSAEILSVVDNLSALKVRLNEAKQVPGIAVYAAVQENDGAYDVATEFNGVLTAIDAVIADIVVTLPKDGSDWLLINKINADGSLVPRIFTGAQLSGLRAKLDVLAASIV